jgi:DNA-binding CsgD family transcriptional regulator
MYRISRFPERGIVFYACHFHFYTGIYWPHLSMSNAMHLLTQREKEVVHLLSLGLTYDQIAIRIDVSHETVKMHLKNIYRKLKVQNKIEALQKVKLL